MQPRTSNTEAAFSAATTDGDVAMCSAAASLQHIAAQRESVGGYANVV